MRRIFYGLIAWVLVISGLHAALNVSWSEVLNDRLPEGRRKLDVAYIPVT